MDAAHRATATNYKVLAVLAHTSNGPTPSQAEIASLAGVSRNTVIRALKRLGADGYVIRRGGHRGWVLP
jgi:DNA-binding GntR family transcriptional regulator